MCKSTVFYHYHSNKHLLGKRDDNDIAWLKVIYDHGHEQEQLKVLVF